MVKNYIQLLKSMNKKSIIFMSTLSLILITLIIVLFVYLLPSSKVRAGYKPPFGGEYTNVCGSGYDANSYSCLANCNLSGGWCETRSGTNEAIYVFTCNGRVQECTNPDGALNGVKGKYYVYNFAQTGTDKTVQIDVFAKKCDVDPNNWSCSFSDLLGYIVWYSGKSESGVCRSDFDKLEPNCTGPNNPSLCGQPMNGYLAQGVCNPPSSKNFYRVCCKSDGTVGTTGASYIQDSYTPPTEGICLSGYPVITNGPFNIPSGQPHPACGETPSQPSQPPSPELTPEIISEGSCSIKAVANATPVSGFLNTNYTITYGVASGAATPFTYTCTKGTSTITQSVNPNCSVNGSLTVTLNLESINKPWGGLKQDTFTDQFSTTRVNETKTVVFTESTLFGRPKYHGDYNFSVNINGNVVANVSFLCPPGYKGPNPKTINGQVSNFNGRLFVVNPTDVVASVINFSSNVPRPQVTTPLRDYIVGFPINFDYKVTFNPPRIFKSDDGDFWLRIQSSSLTQNLNRLPLQNNVNEVSASYSWTPQVAGDYTFSVCHNADDERNRFPNEECKSSPTVTIYRYLCYQGFCWECPKEPNITGGLVNVQSGNCQTVEPAKCQAYISSNCQSQGRE